MWHYKPMKPMLWNRPHLECQAVEAQREIQTEERKLTVKVIGRILGRFMVGWLKWWLVTGVTFSPADAWSVWTGTGSRGAETACECLAKGQGGGTTRTIDEPAVESPRWANALLRRRSNKKHIVSWKVGGELEKTPKFQNWFKFDEWSMTWINLDLT